jgi:hypothetical protein
MENSMKKTEETVRSSLLAKHRKSESTYKGTLNERGSELVDPQPLFMEIGTKRPPRLNERIREVVMLQKMIMDREHPEFDQEAENDFDIPDEDPDIMTPYEMQDRVLDMIDEMPVEGRNELDVEALASALRERLENPAPEPVDNEEASQ